MINRKVYPEVPPRVEYSLTKKGEDLKDVIETMKVFGLKYKGKD
ncbi:MAG: winged helix-turn-helix transcriptional regulator [Lachnospiraceae bacterium]|nr:winged helix-turn-helix transcriptional regulator [Lachnospiraceae bacterium]